MYQLEDLHIPGRLFADGATFKTKKEVRDQLIDYHSSDSDEPEAIAGMTLEGLLDFGDWELIEVTEAAA